MTEIAPSLLRAIDRPESEIGNCVWDRAHNADLLTVSGDGTTVEWGPRKPTYTGKYYPVWVPAITRLILEFAVGGLSYRTLRRRVFAEAPLLAGRLLWERLRTLMRPSAEAAGTA